MAIIAARQILAMRKSNFPTCQFPRYPVAPPIGECDHPRLYHSAIPRPSVAFYR
jgi:hypothetical protein